MCVCMCVYSHTHTFIHYKAQSRYVFMHACLHLNTSGSHARNGRLPKRQSTTTEKTCSIFLFITPEENAFKDRKQGHSALPNFTLFFPHFLRLRPSVWTCWHAWFRCSRRSLCGNLCHVTRRHFSHLITHAVASLLVHKPSCKNTKL
jgi:hypothetical protein